MSHEYCVRPTGPYPAVLVCPVSCRSEGSWLQCAICFSGFYRFTHSDQSRPHTEEMPNTMMKERVMRRIILLLASVLVALGSAHAEPYELSKNDVMEPKAISSTEISLFGVKLGDSESKAVETLVTDKISGVKVEQEATFIFLLDQRKPTGPMAGVRIQDGRVDLLFINNRFTYKTRGIFRNVLNSESPEEIRKVLGQEEYGDENVMGAVMAYDKQGFQVNYLGKDINIEFAAPR